MGTLKQGVSKMALMFFTPDGPQDLSRKTGVPTGFCKPPNFDKTTEIPGNLPVARVFRPMKCERSSDRTVFARHRFLAALTVAPNHHRDRLDSLDIGPDR